MVDDECGEAASAEAVQVTDGAEDAQRFENGGNLFCGCRRDAQCHGRISPIGPGAKRSGSSTAAKAQCSA